MRYQNTHIAIIGGGVGGMVCALALGRAGHRVTILERDDLSMVHDAEAAFVADRRGAPQARQTHGLLARLTRVLRERFPDVLDDLFVAGATEVPLTGELGDPAPGDEELAVLLVRRTTLELVLRDAVGREPAVVFRSGVRVTGLVSEPPAVIGAPPTILGVRLADGEVVVSDAVVASTGRRSELTAWLAGAGVSVPEVVHDTNLMYLTRWYRFAEGAQVTLEPKMAGDIGFVKFLAIPCDGRTFSVTIAVPTSDAELRSRLLDPVAFDAAARSLPGPGAVFGKVEMEPISGVEPLGGLINRLRSFVDAGGQPLVLGLHAIGDAHTCTNPFYGRGCSLAFMQATLLSDAFAVHPSDPAARSIAYEADSTREVEPWFHTSVEMDSVRSLGAGDDGSAGLDAASVIGKVMAASMNDPVIARGVLRVFNMLARPDELTSDIDFAIRVATVLADPDSPGLPPMDGPTREEMLAAVAA